MNSRESERVRGRNGSVGAERIRSGDVSEALTKVLRKDTRVPHGGSWELEQSEWLGGARPSSEEGKGYRHFKPAGCLNPSLRNMTGRDAYVKIVVAHAKEKWEKKKAETDCEARLKEVMANINLLKEIMNNNLLASDELLRLRAKEAELGSELDVMAVSDFSVGRLDLPQISENLHEEFFAKVPSEVNEPGNKAKCAGGQFEDGKFDAEE
ncbi:hypothetical protein DY000_02052831 [Brassica cretica]|uniref:Uncharacterized protein n=1 Tax=Brassica cretica TaxID=69181 RepID=A0ABQ7AEB2_BRACR|nr:hypothetical protein DY000_02052831 [Brassica cretica]